MEQPKNQISFHRHFKSQYCASGKFISILFLDCGPSLYHVTNILLVIRPHSGHNFALFCNFQIRHRVGGVSLGSTWRVHYRDNTLPENLIASKRRKVDDNLAKIEGAHFFSVPLLGHERMLKLPGRT